MSKKILFRRSGDVNLHPIEKLPEDAVEVQFEGNCWVLAKGEATGSEHRLVVERPNLKVYRDSQGRMYFKVGAAGEISHTSDHETTTILPGVYRQSQEREVDNFSLTVRKVVD